MRKTLKLLHVLALVCSLCCHWTVIAAPADLSQQTWILEDPDGRLDIHDVRTSAYAAKFMRRAPNPGITTVAYWIHVTLSSAIATEYWLDSGNRTAQEVDAYVVLPDGQIQHMEAGSRFPFAHRPLDTDSFVFPILVPAGQPVQVYLRLRSTGYHHIAMHLSLWRPQEFRAQQRSEWMQWSVYLGMGTALALVNLMLWAYLRDKNHLNYVFSLFSMALGISCAGGGYGAAFRHFWPDWPAFEQSIWGTSIAISLLLPIRFVSNLIDMRHGTPRLWKICSALVALFVIILTSYITLQSVIPASILQAMHVVSAFVYLPIIPVMLAAVSIIALKGSRSARFIIGAFLPVAAVSTFNSYQMNHGQPIELAAAMWASAFELLVMALALADKVYLEHKQMLAARQEKLDALRRSEQELEQKVVQRTLELQREQSRTRDLLYNILPIELVSELEEKGSAAPARHESATVLFTDFAGFTSMAATMPADRMIAELNDIFAAFDDITDECGVEKIKTIGDAYMAAAGLPKPCADHAQRCVRAGLKMIGFIEQRNRTTVFKWQLRVGIHSGPVVAGVVGKRKYAFDIWGDTVNIASRMESSGEAGKVNVSAYTSDLAREQFSCEYRGKVSAKGKGEVDMYFVVGERDGTLPG